MLLEMVMVFRSLPRCSQSMGFLVPFALCPSVFIRQFSVSDALWGSNLVLWSRLGAVASSRLHSPHSGRLSLDGVSPLQPVLPKKMACCRSRLALQIAVLSKSLDRFIFPLGTQLRLTVLIVIIIANYRSMFR